MKYTIMDQELIDIKNLENIESLSLFNIPDFREKKKENRALLGIIAFTKGKTFSYVQTEKYFDIYLNKLIEQYNKEKENKNIIIDKELLPIFENKEQIPEDEELKLFLSLPNFKQQKICYEKTKIERIKNILFYELNQIKKLTNQDEIYNKITGYREQFEISGIKNNEYINHLISFEMEDDFNYKVKINNFFSTGNGLNIAISFKGNKTVINWISENKLLSGSHEITYNNELAKEEAYIFSNGKCIFYDTNKISTEPNDKDLKQIKNYMNLFNVSGNFKIVKLPWNDFHLQEEANEELENNQDKKEEKELDLSITDNYAYLNYQQQSTITSKTSNYQVKTDGRKSFHHAILGDLEDNFGIIETKFYALPFTKSNYKLKLEDNYFYQYFETKKTSLQDLEEVDAKKIDNLEEKDRGYKLIKKRELNKILKRGEQ